MLLSHFHTKILQKVAKFLLYFQNVRNFIYIKNLEYNKKYVMEDKFDLYRFLDAQFDSCKIALNEIKYGIKTSPLDVVYFSSI